MLEEGKIRTEEIKSEDGTVLGGKKAAIQFAFDQGKTETESLPETEKAEVEALLKKIQEIIQFLN